MFFIYFFAVVATLFALSRAWWRLRYFLHIFQLEGYKPNEFRQWLGTRLGRVGWRRSHLVGAGVLALGATGYFVLQAPFWTTAFLLPAWAVAFASSRLYQREQPKKPLAYTARMKRLLGTAALLALLPVAVGAWLGSAVGWSGWLWYLGGWGLADLLAPLWVLLAAALMQPVETSIQNGFKRQAKSRLRRRRALTVIGITGSYGKTSTKFVIAEILRQRYNVLATPGSFNTPMGICLVINTKLRPEHQVLVLEMGARYRGDIQELCAIAPPDIGIVTNVGVAHLETMGPIENIAIEKGDLIAHMKPDGVAVLNVDNDFVAQMDARAPGKVWRVSATAGDAEITARDLRYGPDGASFTVRDEDGREAEFQTQLLGEHNIQNILLGIAVGREMGLRLRQMVPAVRRLEPVEHRLQLKKQGPITIIDDAFNANPVGAKNAVEVLGQFTSGRRVVVTPGMVELGERQYEDNRTFGTQIAEHADLAVLVGPEQTKPIQDGLRAANYPEDQIHIADTLFTARDYLQTYLQPGDIVLYVNDLPDQYDE